ncbi:MAG: cupin [Verrucomicrobia bacterium]|nr:MAG: cupin [Verrucomicrobiota bacterium]
MDGLRNNGALPAVRTLRLEDDGCFPNSRLPVLIYPGAFDPSRPDLAEMAGRRLTANGWPAAWIDGVYPFHHYHSTAHEALVGLAGWAEVQLGGPAGPVERLSPGDLWVLPAGVAHCAVASGAGLLVLGAYPEGQEWDLCRGLPGERPAADARIAAVPLPAGDPLAGPAGPLVRWWRAAG